MSARGPLEAYFDFDNTITGFDVLDAIIRDFSVNDDWKEAESAWEAGAIGSKECLERQMANVRVTDGALRDYLRTIKVDPWFAPILDLLRANGVEAAIVSDSFTPIIRCILDNAGISGVPVFANDMRLEGDVPAIAFPYFLSICSRSANCKCSHLFRRNRQPGTKKIYAGDGLSDVCPAGFCEILFAKGTLLAHYSKLRPDCIPFEDLGTVHSHLKTLFR